ncbi:NAD-dependent epimerase/dehydratase family protein [Paenibacillus daejeonensis]|uniref:NAD-dependent epimerase/dehydratase family protein n=1 Tax=Paenibacillus daejeonensis TaxID=135193 RepID=UPI00036AE2A4
MNTVVTKKVLVTAKNSYIGNSFASWVSKDKQIQTDFISCKNEDWKNKEFGDYDVILHVAGIAHVDAKSDMEEIYYKVNRDLTIELAEKAKNEGVEQFVFMSSMIVYGESKSEKFQINKDTVPNPSNFYGMSKLQAEQGLKKISDTNFKVAIIRAPMVYGKEAKGNYKKLSNFALKTPVFPDADNERSMLYIDNLCELIKFIILNNDQGVFYPQNKDYVKTSELVELIARFHGRTVRLTKVFNPFIKVFKSKLTRKLFGNFTYSKSLSTYPYGDYQIFNLSESILRTETKNKPDVIIIGDNALDSVGGEQESTKIILRGIKDLFPLGVIQPGIIKEPIEAISYYDVTSETRIKHLVKKPIKFLRYIFRIKGVIKSNKPKVIHTQAQVSFFIISLLKKIKMISNDIKFVHTERGLYTKYNDLIRKVFLFFINELDVFVTTTQFNMTHWEKAITAKKNNKVEFKIIENTAGLLFEEFDENLKKKNSNSNCIKIGFAGRYCDWKNWPLAEEICEKLKDVLGDKLYVEMAVGCLDEHSKQQTIDMFNRLKELLGERFNGAINIDLKQMDVFYYKLDVFILTSNYNTESFGRTLVEAMSRKNIVLTTNSGGSVEVVGNKSNVFVSSDEFSQKVLFYYNNPEEMEEEKKFNLRRVKEVYSLQNNLKKHIALYQQLSNENM